MIDASILLLQDAEGEALALKERAYALAPWLRGPDESAARPGSSTP